MPVVCMMTSQDNEGDNPEIGNENAPSEDETYVDKEGNEYKFKPSRNWNGNKDRNGNFPDKKGNGWSKWIKHPGEDFIHRDIQLPNGHVRVIPKWLWKQLRGL